MCESLSDCQSVRLWERTSVRDSTARTARTLEQAAIRVDRRKHHCFIYAMWPATQARAVERRKSPVHTVGMKRDQAKELLAGSDLQTCACATCSQVRA